MDMLNFDKKRYFCSNEWREASKAETNRIVAVRKAGTFIVEDKTARQMLHYVGFGHQFGDRQDNINIEIFRNRDIPMPEEGTPYSIMDYITDEGRRWKLMRPQIAQMFLSPEEVAYLHYDIGLVYVEENGKILDRDALWSCLMLTSVNFIDKYAVYRKLRDAGWVARSGLPYGCDFLIYHQGPQYYHATAALSILSNGKIEGPRMLAFNRELFTQRKSFLTALVQKPEDKPVEKYEDIEKIRIKLIISKSWLIDRKMKSTLDDLIAKVLGPSSGTP
ncbi:hypothetical protein WR25_24025 [Diploscapter pachys]|uniref:tRNA-intron lyase n=1 Tax=Diploscapter pachys TaxID=2018661 RepID=A0A2A2JXP0_9BILA|nr:hypothetical protein WR25_24025 [Diploscapter pachys]